MRDALTLTFLSRDEPVSEDLPYAAAFSLGAVFVDQYEHHKSAKAARYRGLEPPGEIERCKHLYLVRRASWFPHLAVSIRCLNFEQVAARRKLRVVGHAAITRQHPVLVEAGKTVAKVNLIRTPRS
jgi:hypothetical protein